MSDCAEGAEDHPVIHFIKKTQDFGGKCHAVLLFTYLHVFRLMFWAVFDIFQQIKYGFMQKQCILVSNNSVSICHGR